MNARPYCRCETPRNLTYEEAADVLKCKPRFLEDRIRDLPHQKFGREVAFCPCELALIQAAFTVRPQAEPGRQAEERPDLRAIRPAGHRQRTLAS